MACNRGVIRFCFDESINRPTERGSTPMRGLLIPSDSSVAAELRAEEVQTR